MLLALLVVAGCSSSDADAAAKADFIKKAEVICAKANTDRAALKTPLAPAQIPPFVAQIVAIADEATTKLLALSVPDTDKQEVESKLLNPLKEQVATGKTYSTQVAAASRTKNQAALMKLLGDPPTETKADLRWMKSYGFKGCIEAADTSD